MTPPARRRLVAIVGPGDDATDEAVADAYHLGGAAAEQGWVVLTGGRACGVMDAASRGAAERGGLVVALLPTTDPADASEHAHVVLATGIGEARNVAIAHSAHVMLACGMSGGTASEVAIALRAGTPVILVRPPRGTAEFFTAVAPHAPPMVAASAEEGARLATAAMAARDARLGAHVGAR